MLCKIDAIDVADMARAVVAIKASSSVADLKLLMEGLYKAAKAPRKYTDKEEILGVLVDYYALVESDHAIAQDIVESNPSFSNVSVTLLSLRCIEIACVISAHMSEEAIVHTNTIVYSIQDVVENPSRFANAILLLKNCLSSASYGVTKAYHSHEHDNSSDSDGENVSLVRRAAARANVAHDHTLPAKREISSLLTALGTAVRAFMSRRNARNNYGDSDLSSLHSASTNSTSFFSTHNDHELLSFHSIDLHALFACYLHGSGDPKEVKTILFI